MTHSRPIVRDIDAVRRELAVVAPGDAAVELATIVRVGGTWHRRGTPDGTTRTSVVVASPVGAVVRRVRLLTTMLEVPPPTFEMRAAGGMRPSTTWAARLDADALAALDVVAASGVPRNDLPDWTPDPVAALRAVLLVATSISAPRRRPHLEISVGSEHLVAPLVALFAHVDVPLRHDPGRGRLVGKSTTGIIRVLEVAGAERAAAAHADQRDRRALRNTVVRLTNADEANVARAVRAAGDQVDDLVTLRDAGWETVPEHLREIALVRLANPMATLGELGQLCDPPVGKSTVHRRMAALRELAVRARDDGPTPDPTGDGARSDAASG